MKTNDLVNSLAAGTGRPRPRLKPPMLRTITWLAVSLPWIAMVVAFMGLRPELAAKFGEARWLAEQIAAALTGLTAAIAAFCSVVPGRSRWERVLPAIPLFVWMSLVGAGCLRDWSVPGASFKSDWACLPGIAMVGLVPALAMAIMLRRGAPLSPVYSLGLGGLAATALADFGLRLFHAEDAGLMVLVWQLGSVALFTLICAQFGRWLLRWRHVSLP